jgi:SRSO17 transposase
MKKWIGLILTGFVVMLHAEHSQYQEMPVETIMMGDFGNEITPRNNEIARSASGNTTEEVTVISADEYFQEDEDTQSSERVVADTMQFTMDKPKIALLVPRKVIGGYANSVANVILSYLIYGKQNFVFEVFDSQTQSKEALTLALEKIRHKGYKIVIAPLTPSGANLLASLEKQMLVYVPTVNIDDVYVENPNFLYGGIDYKAQVDALLQYADKKIVIFDDGSALSKKISDYVHESRLEDIVYSKVIKNVKANLSYLFKRNNKLTGASIFLNMPVVKSALVASQLSRYKVHYKKILSTQVNYSPLLFTLTQVPDRERFYIANAIGKAPFALEDMNDLIGSDIRYNWIDYATSVGLDYLFTDMLSFQQSRIFHEELFGQQIYYNTEIVRTSEGSFVHLDLVNAPLSAEETW